MFVLLECWYEGGSNLVDDSFVAIADNISVLADHARSLGADSVALPGEAVPDDGGFHDERQQYRIVEVQPLSNIEVADAKRLRR